MGRRGLSVARWSRGFGGLKLVESGFIDWGKRERRRRGAAAIVVQNRGTGRVRFQYILIQSRLNQKFFQGTNEKEKC